MSAEGRGTPALRETGDSRLDDRKRGPELSVIVPVGPGEARWPGLGRRLRQLPCEAEILFSACEPEPTGFSEIADARWRWLSGPAGRARQLNRGIDTSAGSVLWLLHADARPDAGALEAACERVRRPPEGLAYFDLAFAGDGPWLAALNARGANLRSRAFGLPFGDQGWLLSRRLWQRLGGFDETLALGEDLDFVLRARAAGAVLEPVGARLVTSARRYRDEGWLRTTLRHAWLTMMLVRQARRRIRSKRP